MMYNPALLLSAAGRKSIAAPFANVALRFRKRFSTFSPAPTVVYGSAKLLCHKATPFIFHAPPLFFLMAGIFLGEHPSFFAPFCHTTRSPPAFKNLYLLQTKCKKSQEFILRFLTIIFSKDAVSRCFLTIPHIQKGHCRSCAL